MNSLKTTYNNQEIILNINQKFNRLTIKDLFMFEGRAYCKCECECGTILEKVRVRSLLSGNTKSCGCLNRELTIQRNSKHNEIQNKQKSRLYKIWADMRRRCSSDNRKDSKNYKDKGIKVCDEWNDFSNFKTWALSNGYQDDLTIERLDNSKNYCPENCCWISKSEQSKNRSTNHYITFNNETKTLTDWSRETGINRTTIYSRLRKGWSIERTLTTK